MADLLGYLDLVVDSPGSRSFDSAAQGRDIRISEPAEFTLGIPGGLQHVVRLDGSIRNPLLGRAVNCIPMFAGNIAVKPDGIDQDKVSLDHFDLEAVLHVVVGGADGVMLPA